MNRFSLSCLCALFLYGIAPVYAFNERIVFDPNSGIALLGYDPMGYHINKLPRLGSKDYELYYDGVSWRFSNIGNMKIFKNDPQRYMPVFGGYDPTGLSREKIVAGDPRIFLIYKDKLYLFYSIGNKSTFVIEPDHFLEQAERNWVKLKITLPMQ